MEGIGEVTLAKRRGAKNLRLSITPKGQVRVSLPYWAPYASAIFFAKQRRAWMAEHSQKFQKILLQPGYRVGKSHRLEFGPATGLKPINSRVGTMNVKIYSNLPIDHPAVQRSAQAACERALRAQSQTLLIQRLNELARRHSYQYRSLAIKKMTSRWGSCSPDKRIALSLYLIQLPWHLIDYVILHELVHTKRLHHGTDFWADFLVILPNARSLRKEIKQFQPRLIVN